MLAYKIWPWSVKGLGTGASTHPTPNVSICLKLRFFISERWYNKWIKWNLACKHRPWVYCVLPNLVWISKKEWAQEPPPKKVEIWWKLRYFNVFCPVSATYADPVFGCFWVAKLSLTRIASLQLHLVSNSCYALLTVHTFICISLCGLSLPLCIHHGP